MPDLGVKSKSRTGGLGLEFGAACNESPQSGPRQFMYKILRAAVVPTSFICHQARQWDDSVLKAGVHEEAHNVFRLGELMVELISHELISQRNLHLEFQVGFLFDGDPRDRGVTLEYLRAGGER
jgi:hypothetical protein